MSDLYRIELNATEMVVVRNSLEGTLEKHIRKMGEDVFTATFDEQRGAIDVAQVYIDLCKRFRTTQE